MKKLLLISMVAMLMLAGLAPATAAPPEGFVMTGTDAAFADFDDGDCQVFVGYVWAKRVRHFETGEVRSPHSDVDVKVSGDCGTMSGTEGPVVDNPLTEIVKLQSAFVDGIVVTLDATHTAIVNLAWEATGSIYNQHFREPGMRASHRTRDADVTGTVTITEDGAPWLVFNAGDDLVWSIITHYNEIQNSNIR